MFLSISSLRVIYSYFFEFLNVYSFRRLAISFFFGPIAFSFFQVRFLRVIFISYLLFALPHFFSFFRP